MASSRSFAYKSLLVPRNNVMIYQVGQESIFEHLHLFQAAWMQYTLRKWNGIHLDQKRILFEDVLWQHVFKSVVAIHSEWVSKSVSNNGSLMCNQKLVETSLIYRMESKQNQIC